MLTKLHARSSASLVVSLLSATAMIAAPVVAQEAPGSVTPLPDINVVAPRTSFYENPTGQTATTIPGEATKNTRAFSVSDVLNEAPGIAMKQGNGPRDIGISIRGSNANNGFGVRKSVLFDDGFPVTQPDGLSRTDLIDPHAYSGVDVIRGPSSSLFGDYAEGGALNFRTRTGGEIDVTNLEPTSAASVI